jgi:glycine/D-amino acid oxidase-like deaminating enzyme
MARLNRRELLAGLIGTSAGILAGCEGRAKTLPPAGEVLAPSFSIGHRIRDGFRPQPPDDRWQETDVAVIGGGISGLAAAWRLRRAGLERFVVLEMEPVPGGTSRSGNCAVTPFPWGAHYVPVPMSENHSLIALLRDMGVVERLGPNGVPVVGEQNLCRDPGERIYFDGVWQEGLYPTSGATPRDLDELGQFRAAIARFVAWRDAKGRRAFAIPIATASDDPEMTALDSISMSQWMARQGWRSPRLLWLVDYSCRDDYGATSAQTSAWAGLFYFASRVRGPGSEAQPLITWPEGNGRLVQYLADSVPDQLRCGLAVADVALQKVREPQNGREHDVVEITGLDVRTNAPFGFRARRVVFAAPQLLAPYLIRGLPEDRKRCAREFEYSPWLVANLRLRDRPTERGFPLSWDNVLYDSQSLGYVTATHQTGRDYGPTVLTWYWALGAGESDDSANQVLSARRRLLELTWPEAAEIVLSDLERAHPEIRTLVERLDIMKWGHAMVRPRPGFVWSQARRKAADAFGPIHFAGTDLSGVALCEEAVYHGVRAAEEALHELGRPSQSLL